MVQDKSPRQATLLQSYPGKRQKCQSAGWPASMPAELVIHVKKIDDKTQFLVTNHFANRSDFPRPAPPLTTMGALSPALDTCSLRSL